MKLVVGDIHGELGKLVQLMEILKKDKTSKLIFVGDYIDKGLYSKEVIEYLISLKEQKECVFLRGNHEHMFLKGLAGDYKALEFLKNYGGEETIKSYLGRNITDDIIENMKLLKAVIPKAHIDFLENTINFHEEENFYIVHAGIDPDKPDIYKSCEDIFFIRNKFIENKSNILNKRIIFGHTAFKEPLFEPYKVGIDTGAIYEEYGILTAYNIDGGYSINHNGEKYIDPYY